MANLNDSQDGFPDSVKDETATIISTKGLEAFGRKVSTTASQLMASGTPASDIQYNAAMCEVHRLLKRPSLQRSVFSMARTTPTDLVRSKLSTKEIQTRALSYVPEDMLNKIPDKKNSYSLLEGFRASFSEFSNENSKHRRRVSRGRKLAEEEHMAPNSPNALSKLQAEKAVMTRKLDMLGVRKKLAKSEVGEVDKKIANLAGIRNMVLDRLAGLEQEEALLEHDIVDVETRLEEAQELANDTESIKTLTKSDQDGDDEKTDGFMSQSIYERLPSVDKNASSKGRKPRKMQKKSMPILYENFVPGTMLRSMQTHADTITALDFDAPFGVMVTAAMDDSVRVWDLNAGLCIGLLEGHTASVRTLQIEDNILATGSMDATIRLWDLSRALYDPVAHVGQCDGMALENRDDESVDPPVGTMANCPVFTLQAHVDEVTALHFRGNVLVSGSADKTLRQWDLEKGRCVQTLDVMWAAAQASALSSSRDGDGEWRHIKRCTADATADFVGALQVFESALACGTADGMVRLWDLRSGQVHRSLIGHTGPVTCLQFDDVHLVTSSLDRSVRIWDLRTGSIFDAYAYDNPVTSMMFDQRRIVCAAGEDVIKVYDKVEGRQWDCGAGVVAAQKGKTPSVVERLRIRDGYLIEGRRDGVVGVWTC